MIRKRISLADMSGRLRGRPSTCLTTVGEGGTRRRSAGLAGDPWQWDTAASLPGRAGRRRSGGGGGVWVLLKPFARSGGLNGGLALYSPSRPAQVGGEELPRSQNWKNSIRGPNLRGLLDGRVELYPVYRWLFYGIGPFRGSVRHALRICSVLGWELFYF
jgi:hypothetical protein